MDIEWDRPTSHLSRRINPVNHGRGVRWGVWGRHHTAAAAPGCRLHASRSCKSSHVLCYYAHYHHVVPRHQFLRKITKFQWYNRHLWNNVGIISHWGVQVCRFGQATGWVEVYSYVSSSLDSWSTVFQCVKGKMPRPFKAWAQNGALDIPTHIFHARASHIQAQHQWERSVPPMVVGEWIVAEQCHLPYSLKWWGFVTGTIFIAPKLCPA